MNATLIARDGSLVWSGPVADPGFCPEILYYHSRAFLPDRSVSGLETQTGVAWPVWREARALAVGG